MNQLTFKPIVDLPPVAVTAIAFIWHFNLWARRRDIETNVDIAARLPAARLRVVALLVCVLVLCWTVNLAVWSIFAVCVGIGLLFSVATVSNVEDGAFTVFGAAAYLVREWAFGFPQLILHPPTDEVESSVHPDGKDPLLGKTGVTIASLRPTGDAVIEGEKYAVVSYDGTWIDSGTNVEVKSYRNGIPCVARATDNVRQT